MTWIHPTWLMVAVLSLLLLHRGRCTATLSAGDQCRGPGLEKECGDGLVCITSSRDSKVAFCRIKSEFYFSSINYTLINFNTSFFTIIFSHSFSLITQILNLTPHSATWRVAPHCGALLTCKSHIKEIAVPVAPLYL